MANNYSVKPASGDTTAAVYSDPGLTKKVGSLKSGVALSVTGGGNGAKYYKIRYANGTAATGTVNANSGLNVRSGPGKNYSKIGALTNNTKVTIIKTSSGWHQINYKSGTGWVDATYVKTTSSASYISVTDVKVVTAAQATQEADRVAAQKEVDSESNYKYFTNYSYNPSQGLNNDTYYKEFAARINSCFGTPPKYNMDIDIQYITDVGYGRVMLETFYSSPTILSICPGKVKMFPNLFGKEKDTAWSLLMAAATGNSSLEEKIRNDSDAKFSGKMYTFATDTAGFAKRVNVLCRACAVLLGIGDQTLPGTSYKLVNFDYSYWSIRKSYSPGSTIKDKSIFNAFWTGGVDAVSGAITDKNYIHFLLSNSDTSINESISTNTDASIMSGMMGTLNSATAALAYFTGSGFDEEANIVKQIADTLNMGGNADSWAKLGNNLLKGGQMVLPKNITGVNYGQAISCSLSFISPYGAPMSIFLWCIVPIMHILALSLPKQIADNMYTFPFICRVCQKGWFNSNLACISDVQITRGGNENTSWTQENLATEWNVTFSVVPLIENLMVTSSDNPFLFIKNEGLVDYLGNMCSYDLKSNNLSDKVKLFTAFAVNKYTGIPNNINNWVNDKIANIISGIFHF